MALPKIELPLFELEIPSTKEKVKYRPFTVKEEKILLIAQESGEMSQVILAVKQIVNNCVQGVDVDELALFDLEYILLSLRVKSVSNQVKFSVTDPDTQKRVELELDLENVKLHEKEGHDKKIVINNDSYLLMKYPTVNQVMLLQNQKQSSELLMDTMIACIDKIISGDEIYHTKEFTKEQLIEFLDTLPSSTVKDLEDFFKTMPSMRHEIAYKNEKGEDKTFVIEGLQSFFL